MEAVLWRRIFQSFDGSVNLQVAPSLLPITRPSTGKERYMQKPTTVVLIHGLFMTALSWEKGVERYSQNGYQVIAKSWPGMDGDIEQLRGDPSGVEHLGIGEIVHYYDASISAPTQTPIT